MSPMPGTTTHSESFDVRIGNEVLYRLVDTPGFQRARRAFDWISNQANNASEHANAVAEFVSNHSSDPRFADEVELLRPIIEGAGILYVVDGAVPFGPEYEAEMEILRYTGQPSMALINCIGSNDYVETWKDALGQYFNVVQVFDAWQAPLSQQRELLSAFAAVHPPWSNILNRAVLALTERDDAKSYQASESIAQMLTTMLTARYSVEARDAKISEEEKDRARRTLMQTIEGYESQLRQQIESLYNFSWIDREEPDISLLDVELFSNQAWELWGLSRSQLARAGLVGGAAVGVGLDLVVGGASLLAGPHSDQSPVALQHGLALIKRLASKS